MPYPKLPAPGRGEVLFVCTCYDYDDEARWGSAAEDLGGHCDGDVIALEDSEVRLRLVQDPSWDFLHGGNFPALTPEGAPAPRVIILADIPVVHGGFAPLLVDLREIPGRGVRVPTDKLKDVLPKLLGGLMRFDELVHGMDRSGCYQGDDFDAKTATPTTVVRTAFPRLPATDVTLLVRTDFADEHSWHALLSALEPGDEDTSGNEAGDNPKLAATVVDDRRYAQLQPGQVPSLVPPDEHTTMVALADAATMADPAHPLLVVDLYDTPGQVTRVPLAEAGLMAVNLEIANLDFSDFV
jgi:uncharacterized protein DUF6924